MMTCNLQAMCLEHIAQHVFVYCSALTQEPVWHMLKLTLSCEVTLLYLGTCPIRPCYFDSFESIVLARLDHKFDLFSFPQAPEALSFYRCLHNTIKLSYLGLSWPRQQLQRVGSTARQSLGCDGGCSPVETSLQTVLCILQAKLRRECCRTS